MESLCNSEPVPGQDWNVLVVDNNSQDETPRVVKEYMDQLPLRYVREDTQGLSHARNRALKEFGGKLLAFIDDDVEVDSMWLSAVTTAYREHPDSGFFGGRLQLRWDSPAPSWFVPGVSDRLALIDGLLCHYDLGTVTRPYKEEDPLPFGANFAVSRTLIRQLGVFDTDLGVSGGSVGRGEETDYFMRARAAGFEGTYVGTALAHHRVAPQRLTLRYCFRYGFASGIAHRKLHRIESGSYTQALMYILRGARQSFLGRGDRLRQCVINSGIAVGLKRGTV